MHVWCDNFEQHLIYTAWYCAVEDTAYPLGISLSFIHALQNIALNVYN